MFTHDKCDFGYFKMRCFSNSGKLEWMSAPYAWSPKVVLQHLAGEETIALKPKFYLRYLMIDIDNHNNPATSVEARASLVLEAFDGNPLVYTSSKSGGFRIVYFLDKSYRVDQIERFAQDTLGSKGINVVGGQIEILVNVQSDRLPFGDGSFIVDPVTLSPDYRLSKGGQIDCAYRIFMTERLALPAVYSTTQLNNDKAIEFHNSVNRLLRDGLYAEISTDDALWQVIYYLSKNYSFGPTKVDVFTQHWLHEMHNGCSNSINEGDFTKNERRILEKIGKYDPTRSKGRGAFSCLPMQLSIGDVTEIASMSSDYKTQKRLFGLLAYAKTNGVKLPSIDCAREFLEGSPASAIVHEEEKDDKADIWICSIPSRAWSLHLGFAASAYVRQRKDLLDLGVLGTIYEGSKAEHRCGCFAVKISDTNSQELVSNFDEGLRQLYSRSELKALYGPYRAKKLMKVSHGAPSKVNTAA